MITVIKHVLILCAILSAIETRKLPSFITPCHRKDPELDACLLRAVKVIQPRLKEGIPEMGLPALHPLKIPAAGLSTGNNFNATFYDLEVYHSHEFVVDHLHVDLNGDQLNVLVNLSFPILRIKSNYRIDGKLLIVEIHGQGPADGNFTNIQASVVGVGKNIKKNGKVHVNIDDLVVHGNYGKPVFLFEGLFENNPEVSARTNQIINANIGDIIEELSPVVNKVIVEILQSVLTRVFARYSYDELFLE